MASSLVGGNENWKNDPISRRFFSIGWRIKEPTNKLHDLIPMICFSNFNPTSTDPSIFGWTESGKKHELQPSSKGPNVSPLPR